MRVQDLPAELQPVCTLEEVGRALGISYNMVWKLEQSAVKKVMAHRTFQRLRVDLELEFGSAVRRERKRRERAVVEKPLPRFDTLKKRTEQEQRAVIWQMHMAGKPPEQIAAAVALAVDDVKRMIGRMRA